MAKNRAVLDKLEKDEVLWHDRKRILGMPLSFTIYEVTDDRLLCQKGLLRTETDELLLYRVLDIKLVRTLGQKICGVGTITLYSADQSAHTFEIKNVRRAPKVRRFISEIVERERTQKGLVGREIFGTAGIGMDHSACDHGGFEPYDNDPTN